MFGGRRKSSVKLTKISLSPLFSSFSVFYFSTTPSATTILTIVRPTTIYITFRHLTSSRGGCTTSLSLSLSSLRNSFPSHHRDPSCSSNHPFQRLPPLPATAEATILSSSTPTVSNPSTDHDSSSTSNASSSNFGSSTLHRCHRLHHVVLLGQTTLTPGNFPLPIPLPLLLLLLHYCALRE